MQSSKATSPDDFLSVDDRPEQKKDLLWQNSETQTSPKSTTPTIDTQESEMQTTPEKKSESIIQTSPIEFSQTSDQIESNVTEEVADEKELQTIKQEILTSELSVQTEPHEIVPTQEESVQFVPDTSEISSQTVAPVVGGEIIAHTNQKELELIESSLVENISVEKPKDDESLHEERFEPSGEPKEIEITEQSLIEQKYVPDIENLTSDNSKMLPLLSSQENMNKLPVEQVEIFKESLSEHTGDVITLPYKEKVEEQNVSFLQPREEDSSSIISGSFANDFDTKETITDTTSTPDTSIEIQIHATVEIDGVTSPDSTSQEITITEDSSEDLQSKSKRQKRKRQRHRTVEIRETIQPEEKLEFVSTVLQPINYDNSLISKVAQEDLKSSDQHIDLSIVEQINLSEEPLMSITSTFIEKEKSASFLQPIPSDDIKTKSRDHKNSERNIIRKAEAAKLMLNKVKNSEKLERPSHLSNLLHISTLENPISEKSFEEKLSEVSEDLNALKGAVEEKNIIVIEQTFVTVVETISTWLETIESRIFFGRECPNGPSCNDAQTFANLKDEVNHVTKQIKELENMLVAVEGDYPEQDRQDVRQCIKALENQAKVIEEIANEGELHLTVELARWNEFLKGVNDVSK